MTEQFTVNPGFISVGHLHEITRFGSDTIQDPVSKRNLTNWQPLFIESIEMIGGHVFLGTRAVRNFTSDTEYELNDTIMYENLFVFNRIQRVGTAQKNNQEWEEFNKKLIELQAEARAEAEAKEAAEAAARGETEEQPTTEEQCQPTTG